MPLVKDHRPHVAGYSLVAGRHRGSIDPHRCGFHSRRGMLLFLSAFFRRAGFQKRHTAPGCSALKRILNGPRAGPFVEAFHLNDIRAVPLPARRSDLQKPAVPAENGGKKVEEMLPDRLSSPALFRTDSLDIYKRLSQRSFSFCSRSTKGDFEGSATLIRKESGECDVFFFKNL